MAELAKTPDLLKNRLLVNVLGIPSLLGLIWLGGEAYFVLILAIAILGIREYLTLIRGPHSSSGDWIIYVATGALFSAVGRYTGLSSNTAMPLLAQSLLILLVLLVLFAQTDQVLQSSPSGWLNYSAKITGFIWVVGFSSAFVLIRDLSIPALNLPGIDIGYYLTLTLFIAVWTCDSAAYLLGKRFGKTKILPAVSPKKTIVGSVSGVVGAVGAVFVAQWLGWLDGLSQIDVVMLGLIAGIFGQLGDFVESRFKRDMGVKDSGKLLPGHGGILDRFDSLLFVMPLSYLYITLFIL